MRFVLTAVIIAVLFSGASVIGVSAGEALSDGQSIPYQSVPIEAFSATVKNWSDPEMPHYVIMSHVGEWDNAFQPTPTQGDKRPFHPQPAVFEKAMLVALSRVSGAPAPGQPVLKVKSLVLSQGQLVLTYSFIPPQQSSGQKVKSTLIVAIPTQYADYELRIVEDTETPESLAAERELQEAIREGRFKPEPLPQQPR